jgi:DNA repair exonuclease SbcCD ATPase subunit
MPTETETVTETETETETDDRGTGLAGRVRRRLDARARGLVDEALAPVRRRLTAQSRRIARLEAKLDERLPDAVRTANRTWAELERLQPQLAAVEQRLEELRQRVDTRLDPGTPGEQEEAHRLVDAIRREHEQIRSRMTAISWYEERLRKLEERVGDA